MAKNNIPYNLPCQLLIDADLDPGLKFRIEESYKSIRTNIMLSIIKNGCKTIVISSSNASEGKTTTSINLAISIAQADQRVLLIDGDLRKPKIHHYFSIPNAPGLTNYLSDTVNKKNAGAADLFDIIHPTEITNLSILTSGSIPPNPAEILGSEPMTDFLKEIAKHYDYIIVDTPPINVVSDALPLIRESDGIIVVVKSNASTHPELQKTLESLKFIDAKSNLSIQVHPDDDYAEKEEIDQSKIYVVSVMPCIAKKFERQRKEMTNEGMCDVDNVITTRELARMIKQANIEFTKLEDTNFDSPMGEATGAAAIFGTTGGVMEAALRTAQDTLTGKDLDKIDFEAVRGGEGIKKATVKIADTEQSKIISFI